MTLLIYKQIFRLFSPLSLSLFLSPGKSFLSSLGNRGEEREREREKEQRRCSFSFHSVLCSRWLLCIELVAFLSKRERLTLTSPSFFLGLNPQWLPFFFKVSNQNGFTSAMSFLLGQCCFKLQDLLCGSAVEKNKHHDEEQVSKDEERERIAWSLSIRFDSLESEWKE